MNNIISPWRADFPVLAQNVHGKPLVYLDSAATTQKPRAVLESLQHYYQQDNANVHRGPHELSERATKGFEATRAKVRQLINAKHDCEIIFTSGTTASINLVAMSYGRSQFKPQDEIIISALEHHSNIVPWQLIAEQTGAVIKVIQMNAAGELLQDEYEKLFSPRTKMVALTQVSNSLGTINPIAEMIAIAHQHQVPVLIDGAQGVPHMSVDMQALDCDFYVFSGHKVYGPTGVGVLYGKKALLEQMPPYQGGGNMIKQVTFAKTSYADLPAKFEAGTPNIADVIAFAAAIDYVQKIGLNIIAEYEHNLLHYAEELLSTVKGLRIIGQAKNKASVISFVFDEVHAHDVGTILDSEGIAVRSGHHCTMPVMDFFAVPATVRAALSFYNGRADVDALVNALHKVRGVFKL